jgi:hypothetical protein
MLPLLWLQSVEVRMPLLLLQQLVLPLLRLLFTCCWG